VGPGGRIYFGGRLIGRSGISEGVGVVTDRLGSLGGPARYYPYGQQRQATPEGTEKFATYYRDATGLDYAWNRYYTAAWGRIMQADPYLAPEAPKNPQGWNRYAYVENDPVNWYDPGGLLVRCPFGTVTAPDGRGCPGIERFAEAFTRLDVGVAPPVPGGV